MDTASNPPPSRRSVAPVVASAVGVGLAIGGALAFGSQNLVMGATIGGILALLFGGFAVSATRVPPARGGTHADAGTAVFGSGHSRGDSDAGGSDGGGSDGGGGGGGDAG